MNKIILIGILIVYAVYTASAQPIFPYAPLGECYNGVQSLGPYYASEGHNVQYAYKVPNGNSQGHVWLIVDGTYIDTYYGPISNSEWTPNFVYDSLQDLDRCIMEQTALIESPMGSGNWIRKCPVTGQSEMDRRI